MIVCIWAIAVALVIVIAGEIKYRFYKKELRKKSIALSKNWRESIDTDINSLTIELADDTFAQSRQLSMRGFWRLAKSQIISEQTFKKLRMEEYAKML